MFIIPLTLTTFLSYFLLLGMLMCSFYFVCVCGNILFIDLITLMKIKVFAKFYCSIWIQLQEDENALLQQALAMSMDDPASSHDVEDTEMSDAAINDPELALGKLLLRVYPFFVCDVYFASLFSWSSFAFKKLVDETG